MVAGYANEQVVRGHWKPHSFPDTPATTKRNSSGDPCSIVQNLEFTLSSVKSSGAL